MGMSPDAYIWFGTPPFELEDSDFDLWEYTKEKGLEYSFLGHIDWGGRHYWVAIKESVQSDRKGNKVNLDMMKPLHIQWRDQIWAFVQLHDIDVKYEDIGWYFGSNYG